MIALDCSFYTKEIPSAAACRFFKHNLFITRTFLPASSGLNRIDTFETLCTSTKNTLRHYESPLWRVMFEFFFFKWRRLQILLRQNTRESYLILMRTSSPLRGDADEDERHENEDRRDEQFYGVARFAALSWKNWNDLRLNMLQIENNNNGK